MVGRPAAAGGGGGGDGVQGEQSGADGSSGAAERLYREREAQWLEKLRLQGINVHGVETTAA